MKIKAVIEHLEALAPLSYAEDFDNVGLLVGDPNSEAKGIIVSLDVTETLLEEVKDKGCNMVVCFHPIIFSGLKNITPKTYVERVVIKAIRYDIAIFAIHTAMDNVKNGTNALLCRALGLKNTEVLIPKTKTIKKLTTFVPPSDFEKVREALFSAGAGNIGKYDSCSFSFEGKGTFRGGADSNPNIGKRGSRETVSEKCLGIIFESHREKDIVKALKIHHPYEEVAYEVYTLDNFNQNIGMGMVAELSEKILLRDFLHKVKEVLNIPVIKHNGLLDAHIHRVAVLGGSGGFAIGAAIQNNADILLTADLKYHHFFQGDGKTIIADVGHYESEQFVKTHIVNFLKEKLPKFALIFSGMSTNPINYF